MNNPMLERAAAELVNRLGGIWRPQGAMCRCPAHDDRVPSLSVRVGHSSLLFKCFAGCSNQDVLRAIRRLRFAVPVDPSPSSRVDALPDDRTAALARSLWNDARMLADSPGETYLRARRIHSLPNGLRWHPRTPLGRGRAVRYRPAMLAALEDRGRIVAVQRLFLDPAGMGLARDLVRPKRTLGRPLGGAVRLRPAGPCLGLAEGVESAESAAILLGIPVWAALGGERLHQLVLPEAVERLVLLPDNDMAGRRAERLARQAYQRAPLKIETIWPWWGFNDWNDVLERKEEGVGSRVRGAA
ncbi:MAG: virulence-associated protein E [Sphingobium sp.]|nr:virulence-associated protein E [Sphingobium sp.]